MIYESFDPQLRLLILASLMAKLGPKEQTIDKIQPLIDQATVGAKIASSVIYNVPSSGSK